MKSHYFWNLLFLLLSFMVHSNAYAGLDPNRQARAGLIGQVVGGTASAAPLTAAEVNMLPKTCITIGMGRVNGVFWGEGMRKNGTLYLLKLPQNTIARVVPGFHHYCWGILSKIRYLTALTSDKRRLELEIWRSSMTYLINGIQPNTEAQVYLPLFYTERADSYLVDDKFELAIADAHKAIALNRQYARPYQILVDSYVGKHDEKGALAAAVLGLQNIPDSETLKKQYLQVGGKLPYPEPIKQNTVTADQGDSAGTSQSSESTGAAPGSSPPSGQAAKTSDQATSTAETTNNDADDPAKKWCRFCPDDDE